MVCLQGLKTGLGLLLQHRVEPIERGRPTFEQLVVVCAGRFALASLMTVTPDTTAVKRYTPRPPLSFLKVRSRATALSQAFTRPSHVGPACENHLQGMTPSWNDMPCTSPSRRGSDHGRGLPQCGVLRRHV